jgi:hypothetical protein
MCLGHLVQQPRRDEGDRAVWWQRMNPEVPVPLALAPATANREQDQVPAVGFLINHRARPVAGGPGSAAIGVQDPQPERLFGCPCGPRVRERVERTGAPHESLLAQPHVDGEFKAVRVATHAAHGNGHVIGADQQQPGRGPAGDHAVLPHPRRGLRPFERRRRQLRDRFKKAHAIRLFPPSLLPLGPSSRPVTIGRTTILMVFK